MKQIVSNKSNHSAVQKVKRDGKHQTLNATF